MTAIDTGTDQLACTLSERVLTVTFNRPEARNALSPDISGALRRVIDEQRTAAVVLHGATGHGKARLAHWLGTRAHELGVAKGSVSVWVRDVEFTPKPRNRGNNVTKPHPLHVAKLAVATWCDAETA